MQNSIIKLKWSKVCFCQCLGEGPHTTHWKHDNFIKWKHLPRYWPFVRGIHRSPVNSPHKGQWRRALMFSLICAWIEGSVKNREAGDLRCHCAHYDVIVMRHTCQILPSYSVTYNWFIPFIMPCPVNRHHWTWLRIARVPLLPHGCSGNSIEMNRPYYQLVYRANGILHDRKAFCCPHCNQLHKFSM